MSFSDKPLFVGVPERSKRDNKMDAMFVVFGLCVTNSTVFDGSVVSLAMTVCSYGIIRSKLLL